MTAPCQHFAELGAEPTPPTARECVDCVAEGTRWVHLRLCETCGHVGCCDSSPGKHATAHFHETSHPLVQSYEPGENWIWCYSDEIVFVAPDVPQYSHS